MPGWLRDLAAELAQVPVPPVLRPPAGRGRRSAVLVLFGHGAQGPDGTPLAWPDRHPTAGDDDPDLLLIQRRPGLRRHGGQPAFPGGAIDPGDDGPVQAALREAVEEVGLDPGGVDVIGLAPELYISRSGFRV
ncbi:MAG: NUDIX hydrolase, partial [Streptosporangiaceae bacterium]